MRHLLSEFTDKPDFCLCFSLLLAHSARSTADGFSSLFIHFNGCYDEVRAQCEANRLRYLSRIEQLTAQRK
jgi:hypothetical protein